MPMAHSQSHSGRPNTGHMRRLLPLASTRSTGASRPRCSKSVHGILSSYAHNFMFCYCIRLKYFMEGTVWYVLLAYQFSGIYDKQKSHTTGSGPGVGFRLSIRIQIGLHFMQISTLPRPISNGHSVKQTFTQSSRASLKQTMARGEEFTENQQSLQKG